MTIFLSTNAFAKETIPSVGCPGSDGAADMPAAQGKPVSVNLAQTEDNAVASYAGPYGPRIVAPRGWSCYYSVSADGQYSILIAPTEKDLFGSSGISSPRISYDLRDGGTAGRNVVIPLAGRFFPKLHNGDTKDALSQAIKSGYVQAIPPDPYDVISYRSDDILEFITPANRDGLGTWMNWIFHKSNLPIYGVLRVDWNGDTDSQLFQIRLPENLSYLRQAILNNFENDMKHEDSN